MNEIMNKLLEELRIARAAVEEAKTAQKAKLEAFQQTPEWQDLQLHRVEYDQEIADIEERIKELAMIEWINNQNKHPHEKVEIKLFKTFKVLDPAKVRSWCLENLRDALIVDDKKVKEYAVKIGSVEGTETGEEARVQIASKL